MTEALPTSPQHPAARGNPRHIGSRCGPRRAARLAAPVSGPGGSRVEAGSSALSLNVKEHR